LPPPTASRSKTFLPGDAGFDLTFGRFGHPCQLETGAKTRVVMLQCDEVGGAETAGITVNFYLPTIWASEPFTTETVAIMLRENAARSGQLVGAFELDDPDEGPSYYLLTSALYPESKQGQAFVMKIAPLADAVYSILYTTMFSGSSADMDVTIRKWLADHLTECRRELGRLAPDPSWLPFIRAQVSGTEPKSEFREAR
jgi:hypothetical protein